MKKVIKYCLLVTIGLAVAGCSKESSRSSEGDERENHADEHKKRFGHGGVQLWKDGPYWAETNIGAEKPWESGYYFWWGDTVGYKRENDAWVASDGSSSEFSFDVTNTTTVGSGFATTATLRKERWITADGVLTPEHDAAHVKWGGKWRMPTHHELEYLNHGCDWIWSSTNGVDGYVVRGRGDYASASIFLPVAGYGYGNSLYDYGFGGYYWSSFPTPVYSNYAWFLYFHFASGVHDTSGRGDLYRGKSIRPVQGVAKW